jgi:hypothetical protein
MNSRRLISHMETFHSDFSNDYHATWGPVSP